MLMISRAQPSPTLSRRLLLGTTIGMGMAGLATSATAQTTPAPADKPIQLPTLGVEGNSVETKSYKADTSTLNKLTEPLRDTPQSITAVTQQVMQDQGISTLRDALRNVAGISLAAGEGGSQGDNLTLRGFTARNDIFLDGMRDFGSYYRDSFNYQEVEVLKGPSSILFGRGSTGGVINQESKTPGMEAFNRGSVQFGTDGGKRGTLDIDQPLPDDVAKGAAIRLNVMATDAFLAGRDVGENRRFGVAPSLALGLGTPTRINISFLHQSEYDTPDYGIPFLLGHPAPVSQGSYYGFDDNNYLKTNVDLGTVKVEHDFNDNLTFRNQFRYANYTRDARITEPQIPTSVTAATPLSAIKVTRNEITVDAVETFAQNQSDLTAKFDTSWIHHTVVAGIEFGEETSDPVRHTYTGVPTTPLLAPNSDQQFAGIAKVSSNVTTTGDSLGVYAIDTLKLSDQWSLIGGFRWDRFDAGYSQTVAPAAAFSRVDEKPSWRAAAVYKPLPNGSVYFDYGTSFNPSAEALSLTAANANIAPEANETYEVGTKWDLFDEALSLRTAIFRTEKTNAREPDPTNPLLNILSGDQEVDGFEVEATGNITKEWQVLASYAFMDSKVVESPRANEIGNPLSNAPKHTLSLWTTYELPWNNVQIGGGANYTSKRNASTTADITTGGPAQLGVIKSVPSYIVFQAMAKYAITDHALVQLNLYNLTDKYYYDEIHPAHIVPGAGRTATVGLNFDF